MKCFSLQDAIVVIVFSSFLMRRFVTQVFWTNIILMLVILFRGELVPFSKVFSH